MPLAPDTFREARNRAGYSQQRVAELAGISVATVSRFEIGRHQPHPLIAARLAEVVGIPLHASDNAPAPEVAQPVNGLGAPDEAAA